MIKKFRASGKLLLTGEYLVLQGARALVLPLRHGQTLQVGPGTSGRILEWKAMERDTVWFSARFDRRTMSPIEASDAGVAGRLSRILAQIRAMNPEIFTGDEGWKFETRLEFPREYGWGSSSSLLVLLAQWADVDPYHLHFRVSEGSGYDIAAALTERPFIYSLQAGEPVVEASRFVHAFPDQVFFAYLGSKQDSGKEVAYYQKQARSYGQTVEEISRITGALDTCDELSAFEELLIEHEAILSRHLGRKSLKEARFSDFPGTVKSLGAWGGDFALFIAREGKGYLKNYLAKKGINDVLGVHELFPSKTIKDVSTSTL